MRRVDRVTSVTLLPLLALVSAVAAGGCSAREGAAHPTAKAADTQTGTNAGTGSSSATRTGTVTGRVELTGGPAAGAASIRPVAQGVVTFTGSGRTTAGASEGGRFTAELEPGVYVVTATTPDYKGGRCQALQPVRVTPGHVTSVDVYCQVR